MANKGKNKHFRGDLWFNKQVDERTRNALQQLQKDFVKEHKDDTDEQLLEYVRKSAFELKYTPNAGEIIGGEYISVRLGSWDRVIMLCGLPKPGKMGPLLDRAIYKQEFKRQAALFKREREDSKGERKAVRQEKSAIAHQEQMERLERDMAWGKAHEDDSDEKLLEYLKNCAKELGHSPVTKEVVGGAYIAKRFVSWPVALICAGLPLPKGMKEPRQSDLNAYRKLRKEMTAKANTMATENNPREAVDDR